MRHAYSRTIHIVQFVVIIVTVKFDNPTFVFGLEPLEVGFIGPLNPTGSTLVLL